MNLMTSARTHTLRALVAALMLMPSVQIAAPAEVRAETGNADQHRQLHL
jgi:hypothetical protein